jgi:TRAP-type C4-dicarboxylate transport system substrate-binding protein
MKRALGVLLVLGFYLCLSGPAIAGKVNFKFAHLIPPNEAGSEVGLWIEEELNKDPSGLVEAKYFHSGQLGDAVEIVRKVSMGTIQGGFLIGNIAPDLNPKFGIGTLAYCMDSYEKWNGFLKNKELRDELFQSLLPKGLRVLDLCYFGVYGMASTKPIRSLDDLKGMKMRTTQGKYPVAFWKALGVNPVPLPWGDVFAAIKQGVVDGTDQTPVATAIRLADVTKYFTRTNHMIGLFFFVVNEKWYSGLDQKTRELITQTIAKNFEKARGKDMQFNQESDQILSSKGIEVINLPKEEIERLKATQMSVWKEFEGEIGKEWLDKVLKFTSSVKYTLPGQLMPWQN